MSRVLVVATRNAGKLREVHQLLQGLDVDVLSLEAYPDAPQVDEPFETFAENAARKATVIAQVTGEWALADDSGLEVTALEGAPGVRSARVADTDPERIDWLLQQMRDVPEGRRHARFVCCVALASPRAARGRWLRTVEGIITMAPRGQQGFGFDPVFYYPPAGKTFAQMDPEDKGLVSHRGKSLRAFRSDFPSIIQTGRD